MDKEVSFHSGSNENCSLPLSMAMSAEILNAAGKLIGDIPIELATNLTTPIKCPMIGYMSMEYFRLRALQTLGYPNMFPCGIDLHIEACSKDLPVGGVILLLSQR